MCARARPRRARPNSTFRAFCAVAVLTGLVAGDSATASGPVARVQSCIARGGWWQTVNGTRLFQVRDDGRALLNGALPSACGSIVLQGINIEGPPCVARATSACGTSVEILFVTATSAVLSARVFTGSCADTCQAWSSVAVHADTSVAVVPLHWTDWKRSFR